MSAADRLTELGAVIRGRRAFLGLSWQETLRRADGMSPATYSPVEHGRARATLRTYTRIEKALGYPQGACAAFLDHGQPPEPLGPPDDPDAQLARIAAVWPSLGAHDRRWFLALTEVALRRT